MQFNIGKPLHFYGKSKILREQCFRHSLFFHLCPFLGKIGDVSSHFFPQNMLRMHVKRLKMTIIWCHLFWREDQVEQVRRYLGVKLRHQERDQIWLVEDVTAENNN